MHFLSYQAIAFLLLEVNLILHYYNSVYHAGLILGIILYIAGLQRRDRSLPRPTWLPDGRSWVKF
jgi:hypothetical protein